MSHDFNTRGARFSFRTNPGVDCARSPISPARSLHGVVSCPLLPWRCLLPASPWYWCSGRPGAGHRPPVMRACPHAQSYFFTHADFADSAETVICKICVIRVRNSRWCEERSFQGLVAGTRPATTLKPKHTSCCFCRFHAMGILRADGGFFGRVDNLAHYSFAFLHKFINFARLTGLRKYPTLQLWQ